MVSKWLFSDPDVLILDEPTRGIDVGAKYEIYTIIAGLAAEGKAIIVISSEMPELLGITDRIYVMNEGRIVGEMAVRGGQPGKDHARHRRGEGKSIMTIETAPEPPDGCRRRTQPASRAAALPRCYANLRDYGLILALIAIMIFFQFTTNGVLFKPVNLTNLVLQNSYIIIMALGMLLVIVAGHIDLSVGSVSGFIGALAAMMMVTWHLGPLSPPDHRRARLPRDGRRDRRGAGLLDRLSQDTEFHRHAGRHAGVQGAGAGHPRRRLGRAVPARIPGAERRLHPRFHRADGLSATVKLHATTLLIGILIVLAIVFFGLRGRANRARHGYATETFALFAVKTAIISALTLFLVYSLATYKGLPNVLVVMSVLIALFVFVTKKTTIGRRVYAMGGNLKAASLSGIKTERLTLLRVRQHGRARRARRPDLCRAAQHRDAEGRAGF